MTSRIVKYSFTFLGNVESLEAVVLKANIIGLKSMAAIATPIKEYIPVFSKFIPISFI